MCRPNVYKRSAPRARRIVAQEPGADYGPAARATIAALPDLLRQAAAVGAVTLARYFGQALREAERIVRRDRDARMGRDIIEGLPPSETMPLNNEGLNSAVQSGGGGKRELPGGKAMLAHRAKHVITIDSRGLMFIPLAVYGIYRIASALQSGSFETRSGSFRKKSQPARFKFEMVVLTCTMGVCCLFAVPVM